MRKYTVTIIFADGELNARVVARSKNEALTRVLNTTEAKQFIAKQDITTYDIELYSEDIKEAVDPKRYAFAPISEREYLVSDKHSGVSIRYAKGDLVNAEIVWNADELSCDALKLATIMREFGDYLQKYHADTL